MEDDRKPKNLRSIDLRAVRVIRCCNCDEVVAQDLGRPIDRVLIRLAIESHVNHPRTELTRCMTHQLETVDMKARTSQTGVNLWERIGVRQ